VAEIAPKPDVLNQLRKLPQPAAAPSSLPMAADVAHATHILHARSRLAASAAAAISVKPSFEPSAPQQSPASTVCLPAAADAQEPAFALQPPRSRASCTPLRPGRYKLQLGVGQALHDKLEQLQELLRHRLPDGDLARIVGLAVDGLLDKTLKQRFAQSSVASTPPRLRSDASDAPLAEPAAGQQVATADGAEKRAEQSGTTAARATSTTSAVDGHAGASPGVRALGPRYVRRSVLREVYARDGGQCTFVSAEGRRCSARGLLEVHHVMPHALGGAASVDDLRLICRAHNALLAQRDYRRDFMLRKLRQERAERASATFQRANAHSLQQPPVQDWVQISAARSVQNVRPRDRA